MRITVDARMQESGGIGTYIRHLLPFFEKYHVTKRIESKIPIYSLREQLHLPLAIPSCELFWSPHFNVPFFPIRAKKRVVTIHDLYHLDHLDSFSFKERIGVKLLLKKAILSADHLITVSQFSKSRILHHFPEVKSDQISVIYSGCDHLNTLEPKAVEGLPEKFFLFVGSSKLHKNLPFLLNAFAKLNSHLVVSDKVSSRELVWLYRNAEALIFPSLYEGWGLPPLEAMALNCPVLASNQASIPEACGNAACYFDPQNETDFLDKLKALPFIKDELIQEGKKRTAEMTWEKAALQHLQVFEKLC